MEKLVEKTIPITRMDCPTCIPVLEKEVKQVNGVEEVRGNYVAKYLKVKYDPEQVTLTEIEQAIERVGYRIAYKKYPSVFSRIKGLLTKEKSVVESITDQNFPEKVLHALKPVAVLFSSPTCPICHIFKPRYDEVAEHVKGKANLYDMDISRTETWRKYDILSIPTVLVFRNGELSERITALPRKDEIEKALET